MDGVYLLYLALVMTLSAGFMYLCSRFRLLNCQVKTAGKAYSIACVLTGIAAVLFLANILTDQFQFAYVYNYSWADLPLGYKLSAFWAGQEGSCFFWLVCHAVFGLAVMRQKQPAPAMMAVYCGLQCLLLAILAIQDPFRQLYPAPADGKGLNLLLQDPWMVIHPPLIFLGYAGLAIPLSFAIGALLDHNHEEWLIYALPWSLLSWTFLSAGIFIGGFWAYEVLGWGGYWAWDPVENSSLVPWLFAGAFIHCLLAARSSKAGLKAAYCLAIVTFIMVLYGTFLTRSGLLSAFSVHSFADEGIGGLFAILLPVVTLGAVIPLIIRWPELPESKAEINSREFIIMAGSLALAVFAVLVLVGMSTPLISLLLNSPHNIGADYYNTAVLPVAAVIFVLIAIAVLLNWRQDHLGFNKYRWTVLAGVVAVMSFTIVLDVSMYIVLVMVCAAMAAFGNIAAVLRRRVTISAAIAHIGLAIMTIGILASSAGNQTQINTFSPGQMQQQFGTKLIYRGVENLLQTKIYKFELIDGSCESHMLQAVTKLNKSGRPAVREPAIHRGLSADIYVAVKDFPTIMQKAEGQITVDISRKPLTSFVWLGAVITTIGVGWAGMVRLCGGGPTYF